MGEWGVSLSPRGAAFLYLYLLEKLIIAAAEADYFFPLGIILKTSSSQELVAGFFPVMSIAKTCIFFFLRKINH